MTPMRTYTVILTQEPEDGRWNASVPALDGCFTFGETKDEAIEMAQEAISGFIAVLSEQGEDIPEDISVAVATVQVDETIVVEASA